MLQKIIKVMVTLFTDFFMILSKAVTIDPVKKMFTDWLKFQQILLPNVLLKVFLLPEIMAVY